MNERSEDNGHNCQKNDTVKYADNIYFLAITIILLESCPSGFPSQFS